MKKIGYGTHLILYILIVMAILAVINYISLSAFYRVDLTENRIYSISKSTKNVLKDLDDVVSVQAYFSKELPPQLVELRRQVKDILDEYTAYAGTNLSVEFIDPEDDPELSQRMQFIGVPKVQVNIFQRDKAEVANLYLGMSIMFEDRKEVIPVIQNVKNLEYDLTSAILKVIKKDPEVVGFVSWQKDTSGRQPDQFSTVQMALQKQYDVRNISLSQGKSALNDVDTLVLLSPEQVSDQEQYQLDQFLMRGGKEIFLVNMVRLQVGRQLAAEKVTTNINDVLTHFGVRVLPDLVLDRSNSMAAFSGGFFHFQVPYPFWPKVRKDGFDPSHPMVSKLETVTFPWTSSVKVQENVVQEKGLEKTILIETTPHGWTQTGKFDLNPQQRFNMKSENFEKIPMAVLISGIFESAYKDKNPPAKDENPLNISAEKTHIVVVGNSRFIEDDFVGRFPENAAFFLNMVDWLTMGDALIGIRTREKTERPLPAELSDQKKAFIRYINIFGVSIFIILLGLVKLFLKRRKGFITYEL
ncbi:MAG: GldG family protein [bacterium]